jgi:transcriptional regulator with XRE-family HTH domain
MPLAKPINEPSHLRGARLPAERSRDIAFSKRLQQLMHERELTQSDLAAKIWGRTKSSEGKNVARGRDRISVWTNGKNIPDTKNLNKLAKALVVKVSDLIPEAEMKAAHRGIADWSFTKPHGGDAGQTFVQIAQFVSDETAHAIQGLLLKDAKGGH